MSEVNSPSPVMEKNQNVELQDILYQCLNKWYWFVLSVLLFGALGYLYILRTPPVYNRSMTVLIKENNHSARSATIDQQLSQIGLVQSSKVANELIAFQSPALITDVVKRLHLDVNYSVKGPFHDQTLYGSNLPIQVQFLSLTDRDAASLTVNYKQDGSLELTDFVSNRTGDAGKERIVKGRFGQVMSTPVGRVLVTPTVRFGVVPAEPVQVYRSTLYAARTAYSRISVTQKDKESTMIEMSINDVSAERAEDVLKTLVEAYNDAWLEDKNKVAANTSKFINDRLRVIEEELGSVDRKISSYKSSNLLPDDEAASQVYLQKSETNNDKILDLRNQIYMARMMNEIASNGKKPELLPANSGIKSGSFEGMVTEYNNAVLQRNRLIMNSSADSPVVTELDGRINKQRQAIVSTIDNLIMTLEAQLRDLETQSGQLTSKMAKAPNQQSYLTSIGREQQVKQSLYIYLLQKREENELSMAFSAYNNRIITPPTGRNKPVSPIRRNVFLIAFGLGLALPFGLIYAGQALNTRVRGRKDLEKLTIPFVGEIPYMEDNNESRLSRRLRRIGLRKRQYNVVRRKTVVEPQNGNVINEAYRVLRANFEFTAKKYGAGVVTMIVSANPGSGKTFITMNLAMSLAIKQKRVIVLDLDLRKSASSKYVGNPHIGFSNYLNGQCELDEIICHYDNTSLDVIPVGTTPPNPTELLYEDRLGEAIAQLKQRYDYIFLDCPPVEIVADSSIIQTHADLTLFVVRAHLLERSMLNEVEELYRASKYPSMSIVLNATDNAYSGYGYRKYGYRYGYRYGYGSYGEK